MITLATLLPPYFFSFWLFFLHCLLVFLYCSSLCDFFVYKSELKKSFILYFHTELFQCELMTVFVIVAGRVLLGVMCWKLACMLWLLSEAEDAWIILYSIQPLWLWHPLKSPVGGCLERIYWLNFLLGVAFSDLNVTAFSLLFQQTGAPRCRLISHATDTLAPEL